MTPSHFTGLIAAPFTPFQANGSLALDVIPKQAAQLAADGVSGAFVCGSTGEGASLTMAERKQVAEVWVQSAPAGLPVIVHVGHTSVAESCELARHAAEAGATAFAAYAPHYFKPGSAEDLVRCCETIAAAAPNLPFYYYHIPSMTGVGLSCESFLATAHGRIPNLAGIKFTHENLMDYLACQRFADGRYDILFGRDECLLAALSLGARGAVGSTYNYIAPIFVQLLEALAQGDEALAVELQSRANRIIQIMIDHGGQAAGKAIASLRGTDLGPVRAPMRALDAAQKEKLVEALRAAEFFV